jgi:hypothetical protein
MIRQQGGKYVAYCDGECGASVHTGLRSFHQAINYISRVEEWENRNGKASGEITVRAAVNMPTPNGTWLESTLVGARSLTTTRFQTDVLPSVWSSALSPFSRPPCRRRIESRYLGCPECYQMASLKGIAPNLRTILAAHVPLQFVARNGGVLAGVSWNRRF